MLTTLKTHDGTFASQPKEYFDKLADTYRRLFNEDPPKGYKTPLDKNDHPELDTSEILEGDMAAKYLTMVGQLQWLVTLGRFDIHAQVATMSRFRAAPRQGHMDRLKRIYSTMYLMILKLLITRGNITLMPKEATQEKEKENLKLQPEKLKRERKRRIKIRKNMINTPTTTWE